MQQCAVHVEFQLPNEYSRVGYFLDAIETTDASLRAAMDLVRNDDHPLYRDDNASLYFYLEEATRSTLYTSSIQPFS